jgi:hypothetical protein
MNSSPSWPTDKPSFFLWSGLHLCRDGQSSNHPPDIEIWYVATNPPRDSLKPKADACVTFMLSSVRVCFCVCVCLISQKIENVLFIFECHPLLSSYGIYICMSNGCMYVYIYTYTVYVWYISIYIYTPYITRAPAQGIATLANESNVVMGSGWRRPTVYRGGRWRCVCRSCAHFRRSWGTPTFM